MWDLLKRVGCSLNPLEDWSSTSCPLAFTGGYSFHFAMSRPQKLIPEYCYCIFSSMVLTKLIDAFLRQLLRIFI